MAVDSPDGTLSQPLSSRDKHQHSLKIFLILFTILAVVFLTLWHLTHYLDTVIEDRERLQTRQDLVDRTHQMLSEAVAGIAADLRIVARGQNLHRLASGEDDARAATVRDFEIFASEKPIIEQLRFLDPTGHEIVRIDRRGATVASVAPPNLQDKSDRYYFRHAIALPEDGIYVSKLDLNVERGVVEEPWRPMLRLATPIFSDGTVSGIVVMNVGAGRLIAGIEAPRDDDGNLIQLLNRDGYWLAGVADDRLWGFMFGRDATFAATAPEAWRHILSAQDGSFDDGERRYLFRTLRPSVLLSASARAGVVYTGDGAWIVLGTLRDVPLLDPWRIDRLPVVGLGLLAIAAVCFGWSTAIGARQSILEQKRRTEAELIRLDRMASLGTLVAGLAHELNTPIGNAVTVASTLAQRVAQLEPEIAAGRIRRTILDEFLVEMREGTALLTRGVERAADLIRHFKQLAVDQASAQRRTFRMTDIVDDVVSTLGTQFKNSPVSLKTEVTTRRVLDGYPGLLGQALTNLANNALVHGFDDGQIGTVTITARNLPGDKVEIAVRDTGKGMAPDIRKHAFEPFFTTRLGSGGSGLGLSIVHNIVTTVLGGSIRIESDPGTGTVVYMQLPVHSPGDKNPHTENVYNVHRPPAP